MKLLSVNSDAKTKKSLTKNYLTGILYLAPYTLGGKNLCPMAEIAKCHGPCLNTAGRGAMNSVQSARIRKSQWFNSNPSDFIVQLKDDIKKLIKRASKINMTPCVRLNGTSDIRWENYDVIQSFPDVQFYDYTKIPNRNNKLSNYHLTWSYSHANEKYAEMRPDNLNWAVVFRNVVPDVHLNRPVVNGDETDLRFLDPSGVVVGLSAKGRAKKDQSGFVV